MAKSDRRLSMKWRAYQYQTGVYAVLLPGTMAVKIGWSANMGQRLENYTTSFPFTPRLVGIVPGASSKTEKKIHKQLDEYRLRGEWFLWCDGVRDFIADHFYLHDYTICDRSVDELPIREPIASDEQDGVIDMLDALHKSFNEMSPSLRRLVSIDGDKALTFEDIALLFRKKPYGVHDGRWKTALSRLCNRLKAHGDEHLHDAILAKYKSRKLPVDLSSWSKVS